MIPRFYLARENRESYQVLLFHSGRGCQGVLVAAGCHATNSGGQGGKATLQCVPVKPANVTRLERVRGEAGELAEGVRLGEVGIMTAWRWGRVAGVEV